MLETVLGDALFFGLPIGAVACLIALVVAIILKKKIKKLFLILFLIFGVSYLWFAEYVTEFFHMNGR